MPEHTTVRGPGTLRPMLVQAMAARLLWICPRAILSDHSPAGSGRHNGLTEAPVTHWHVLAPTPASQPRAIWTNTVSTFWRQQLTPKAFPNSKEVLVRRLSNPNRFCPTCFKLQPLARKLDVVGRSLDSVQSLGLLVSHWAAILSLSTELPVC